MECNIESLPGEVLAHIFSFLDWRDKLNVSSTCKHLMNAINYRPELFDDVCVEIHSTSLESCFEIFSTTKRNFCYFSFHEVDVDIKLLSFIVKFAALCRRLHFKLGDVADEDAEVTRRKIENCSELWELKVWASRAFMMFSHLPKLKTLCVDRVGGLSSLEYAHIQIMAPSTLTDFSMKHRDLGRIESSTLYRFLDKFIRKCRHTLQSLDLGWNKIKGKDFVELSRIEGLKLRSVYVPELFEIEEGDLPGVAEFQNVISFCHNQRTIVDMSFSLDIDDDTWATICKTLPQMEGLGLNFGKEIDRNLSPIFQLKRLQKLNITDYFHISPDVFLKSLDGFSCHDLKHLELSFTNVDDEVMSRLLPLVAANLRELILYICFEITDLTVFVISRCLTSLRTLNLYRCPKISNDGFLGHAGSPQAPGLSNIKGLEVLLLNDCGDDQLTEDGLIKAIQFEHLKELELTDSVKITESGRMALMAGNPKLRTLRTTCSNC